MSQHDSITNDPSSPRFEQETRRYLQHRLRLLAGAVALLTAVLGVAFVASLVGRTEGPVWRVPMEFATVFPNSVLFWMIVSTATIFEMLRRRAWSPPWLAVIDGALLLALIAPCLILYGLLHSYSWSGFSAVIPFLTLFVLARPKLTA